MKFLAFGLLVAVTFYGCPPQVTYPDNPYLEFKALDISEDAIKKFTLSARFTDGDGDIGYYQDRPNDPIFDDITSDYYYNFVIEMQVQKNGIWKDTSISYESIDNGDTTIVYYNDLASARLPYLTQDGHNKSLNGDIEKTAYLPLLLGDTIRFRAFIYDRSLNKSNVIFTPGYFVKNP